MTNEERSNYYSKINFKIDFKFIVKFSNPIFQCKIECDVRVLLMRVFKPNNLVHNQIIFNGANALSFVSMVLHIY